MIRTPRALTESGQEGGTGLGALLAENEYLLARIQRLAHIGCWEWFVDTGMLRWSEETFRIFGRDPDAFVPSLESLDAAIHPEDLAAFRQAREQALREGGAARFEHRIVRPDGDIRHVVELMEYSRDTHGQLAHASGTVQDVTNRTQVLSALRASEERLKHAEDLRAEIAARKCAEVALRRREREFATLVEHSPDIIMRFDRQLRHLYVSPAVRRVVDRDPREWLGKTCAEVGFPEHWCRYWESVLERVFRTGEPAQEEYDYEGDRGTVTLDWRLVPEFDADGQVETVLSIFRDITAIRQAEARRLAAEERFRMLIEHSPDGLALNDAQGRVVFQSPSLQRILGYSPDELLGSGSHDLIHPEDMPRIQHEVMPSLLSAPGAVVRVPMRMRHKDGRWRHLDTVATNMLHVASVEAIVINYRDITPEVEALDAQQKAEAELAAQQLMAVRADRLRSLGEMAAGIAHELNQPVGGIRALAEQNLIALRRKWRITPAELEQELRLIVEQADRMSHIINHVRMFARDAGSPAVQAVDLNEVVASSVGLVGAQLRARGIVVKLDLLKPLPPVDANPFSLEEVLLNLLRNAEQAIGTDDADEGGRIGIRTCVVTDAAQRWIRVDVSDTGSGIPPEIEGRLFEPFFTTKDPDAGSGLGLPICRSIVESYGGHIRLESRPGEGVTAVVLLPVVYVVEASIGGGED